MPVNSDALALVAKINKDLGEGAVRMAADMVVARRFPSGSLSLDVALGGGWPGNQWIEMLGQESHGKTAVILKTIAENQRVDPEFTTFWVAAEHYNKEWATALGVDNDRVIIFPTNQMEVAYAQMLAFAESRSVDCIVLDSYPALIADEEAAKEMDEVVVALGARLTGKFFRKAGSATHRSMDGTERPILPFIINQWRDQIGGFSPHGTPKTSPGGKAKNYAFYVRTEAARGEWIDETRPGRGKVRVGQVIKVRTIKNKSAAPQQVASVDFYFRDAPTLGFYKGDYDTVKEITTMGILFGVIKRAGAYFSYGEDRWKGKEGLLQAIREDLDVRERITADVLAAASKVDVASISDDEVTQAEEAGVRSIERREPAVAV